VSTRTSIRNNVVTALTGLTTTGSNVFRSRVYPIAEGKLPGICIFTATDESEYATTNPPRTLVHLLTLTVEAYVKANVNYDATLDTIQSEIETALAADITRGGHALDTRVTSFVSNFSDEGDQPIAYGEITVEIDYTSAEG
tara:strand:+ start:446 stop:868 length:423 start_codon:yes stop_codon:yes gene_type:complete